MSQHYHAIVWIDHHEARVFHFSANDVERLVLHPDHPTRHIHHKANSIGSGHDESDRNFFQAVTESIASSGAILITSPANAKTELLKYIHRTQAHARHHWCGNCRPPNRCAARRLCATIFQRGGSNAAADVTLHIVCPLWSLADIAKADFRLC
jgi:hypothetical protein